jgi:predicted permease
MTPRRDFGWNLRSLKWWRRADEDVAEEMRLHVELRTRELESLGLPADAAGARARREVGRPADVIAVVGAIARTADRQSAWRQRLEELGRDIRLGARAFRRQPLQSCVAAGIIAVGLGANAAIFALVNTLHFRTLPFDPEERLVRVREFRVTSDGTRINGDGSRRTADAIAQRPDLFDTSVAVSGVGRTMAQEAGAIRVAATRVGPGFTRVLQLTPQVGRTFTEAEETAGDTSGAVLISDRFWRRHFGGDRHALGASIRLDGQPFSVVGVLPPAFHVPYDTDLWFPSRFGESERSIFILARMARGQTVDRIRAALAPIGDELNALYPAVMRGLGVTAVPVREYFVGNQDRAALALMAAVGVLLLIACTNVAVLLATRFAARRTEVAVRAALGCGRGRLIRQFVTEGLVLFAVGGAAGLLAAAWLKDVAAVFLPETMAAQVGLQGVAFDGRVIVFSGALSAAAGIGFGLMAALRPSREDVTAVMKDAGRSSVAHAGRGLLGRLVVVEVALALVLVTAAGVMVQTYVVLRQRDLGFDPTGVVTGRIDLNAERYQPAQARVAAVDAILERLRATPVLEAVAATTVNPICCGDWGARLVVEGHAEVRLEDAPIVQHYIVTPEYFATMKMNVVAGRGFTPDDREGRELVAVVDRTFASRYWPEGSVLGRRIRRAGTNPVHPWLTIVGVVEPIVDNGEYPDTWYLPHAQHATGPSADGVHLMVRSGADTGAAGAALRAAVASVDPHLALFDVRAMDTIRAANIALDRRAAFAVATLAAAGLLLAAVGLYGVLAFVVTLQMREIGLRVALGASRTAVLGLVVARGARPTAIGLAIGTIIATLGLPYLRTLVPEASLDWRLIAVSALALVATCAVASIVPARRALRLDPTRALQD